MIYYITRTRVPTSCVYRAQWLISDVMLKYFCPCFFPTDNRPQTGGAILLKCNGTVINLDPVLFTWLAYYPRMSPTVDTSSRAKHLRKVTSHTRSVSGVTPRRKSYARGTRSMYSSAIEYVVGTGNGSELCMRVRTVLSICLKFREAIFVQFAMQF